MKEWIRTLIVGLLTTVVGVVLGWYLSSVYDRPRIEWYSRPYYKVSDFAVGNIFLTNNGRKTDRNISITLDSEIKDENIKIVDLTSSYKILHNDNKTSIIIDRLEPEEAADISFLDDPKKDDVLITNFSSEYSNIVELPFSLKNEWWYLPLWLEGLIILTIFFAGSLTGMLLLKKKSHKI